MDYTNWVFATFEDIYLKDVNIKRTGNLAVSSMTIAGDLKINGDLVFKGVTTFNGLDQTITNISKTTIEKLVLKSQGDLSLDTRLLISDYLQLSSGKVKTTSDKTLTLNPACLVIGGSNESFVNGPVRRLGYKSPSLLPVGKGNIYNPLTVSYGPDAYNNTIISVEYFQSDPTLAVPTGDKNVVSNCEYWKIEKPEGPGRASFSFPTENCSATPEKDLNILFYDTKTTSWTSKASSISNSSISLTEYTPDFGIYALGKGVIEKEV